MLENIELKLVPLDVSNLLKSLAGICSPFRQSYNRYRYVSFIIVELANRIELVNGVFMALNLYLLVLELAPVKLG